MRRNLWDLKGSLDWWLVTEMWYLVASLFSAWVPPRNCLDVSGAPNTIVKALQVLWKALEKPSAQMPEGCGLGVSFSFVMPGNYMKSKEEEILEAKIGALEEDL